MLKINNYSCKYFDTTNNTALNHYLSDIRKYSIPTEEEEKALLMSYKNDGDQKAKDELMLRNQRFIFALAKIYARDENEVLDYVSEGNEGLSEGIDKYEIDNKNGARLLTYASLYVRREMNYFLTTTNNTVVKSNGMKLGKKVDRIKNKYFLENGFYPTSDYIINVLKAKYGIEIKDERDIIDLSIESINKEVKEDYTIEDDSSFNDKTSSFNNYEENVETDYKANLINNLFYNTKNTKGQTVAEMTIDMLSAKAKHSLTAEDINQMIKMRFGVGFDHVYSNEEIGCKYDYSSETIDGIINYALSMFNEYGKRYKYAV